MFNLLADSIENNTFPHFTEWKIGGKNIVQTYHANHETKVWCCLSDSELTWRNRWENMTYEEQLSNCGF
jgi:hypothetical protein